MGGCGCVYVCVGGGGGGLSKENVEQESFAEKFLHSREYKSCVICHLLQEYLFQLDRMRDCYVALLWIFDRIFADRTNFLNQCLTNHPFQFGSFIPNKNAQITGACVDLKPVTLSKRNFRLNIIRIENQNAFLAWVNTRDMYPPVSEN